jgi:hypothetical protein
MLGMRSDVYVVLGVSLNLAPYASVCLSCSLRMMSREVVDTC